MVQINFARKEINCKIVYYGPGLSGKTTSLEVVHQRTPEGNKGELTSISTDGDRTLFFDFMPLDLGTIAGMKTKFHLYTVPGQVYYNSTRKLVLLGADGVIFVADSSPGRMDDNIQSMENLRENLAEMGRDLNKIPLVIQYNKRDVPGAMTVEEMEAQLNPNSTPHYEASAKTGEGIFQTLKAISALVLEDINSNEKRVVQGSNSPAKNRPPAAPTVESGAAAGASGGLMPSHEPGQVLRRATAKAPAKPTTAAATATAPTPSDTAAQPPVEPMEEAAPAVNPVAESRAALARQIQDADADNEGPTVQRGRSSARGRRGAKARQKEAGGSGTKLGIFLVLGILAGAAAAVAAYKLVIEPGSGL